MKPWKRESPNKFSYTELDSMSPNKQYCGDQDVSELNEEFSESQIPRDWVTLVPLKRKGDFFFSSHSHCGAALVKKTTVFQPKHTAKSLLRLFLFCLFFWFAWNFFLNDSFILGFVSFDLVPTLTCTEDFWTQLKYGLCFFFFCFYLPKQKCKFKYLCELLLKLNSQKFKIVVFLLNIFLLVKDWTENRCKKTRW